MVRHREGYRLPISKKQRLDSVDVAKEFPTEKPKHEGVYGLQRKVLKQQGDLQKVRQQHWPRSLAAPPCLTSSVSLPGAIGIEEANCWTHQRIRVNCSAFCTYLAP